MHDGFTTIDARFEVVGAKVDGGLARVKPAPVGGHIGRLERKLDQFIDLHLFKTPPRTAARAEECTIFPIDISWRSGARHDFASRNSEGDIMKRRDKSHHVATGLAILIVTALIAGNPSAFGIAIGDAVP
jgi:hypothetical protein